MICPECGVEFEPKGMYMLDQVKCTNCDHRFYYIKNHKMVSSILLLSDVLVILFYVYLLQITTSQLYKIGFGIIIVVTWMILLKVANYCLRRVFKVKNKI
jgi:hypothetical protein